MTNYKRLYEEKLKNIENRLTATINKTNLHQPSTAFVHDYLRNFHLNEVLSIIKFLMNDPRTFEAEEELY